jgi:hypothetical protein
MEQARRARLSERHRYIEGEGKHMARELLNVGDRLISVQTPGQNGNCWKVGSAKVLSIGVDQLPGPMGFYLVANIVFESMGPDLIIPLHMTEGIEVLNP